MVLITVLSTLLAVYVTNRHARSLAERSGAFRRPNIGFVLLDQPLVAGNAPLAWYFIHPGQESERVIYKLPFAVTNSGDARCEDVIVTLLAPAECFGDPKATVLHTRPGVLDGSIKHSVIKQGHLKQVSYRLDKIGAKSAIGISDLIIMTPSVDLPHTVRATTSDNNVVKISLSWSYAYVLQWSIYTPDEGPLHFRTPVCCISASTIDEVATKVRATVADGIESHLARVGRLERLFFKVLHIGVSRTVVIVHFGKPQAVESKGYKVYRLDDDDAKISYLVLDCFIPRFMEWNERAAA